MKIKSINIRPEGTWGNTRTTGEEARKWSRKVSIYRKRKINWIPLTWAPTVPPAIKSPPGFYLPRFTIGIAIRLLACCISWDSQTYTLFLVELFAFVTICSNGLLKFGQPFFCLQKKESEITTTKITCRSTSHSATEAACILTSYFCQAAAAICLALQYLEMFWSTQYTWHHNNKKWKSRLFSLDIVVKTMAER